MKKLIHLACFLLLLTHSAKANLVFEHPVDSIPYYNQTIPKLKFLSTSLTPLKSKNEFIEHRIEKTSGGKSIHTFIGFDLSTDTKQIKALIDEFRKNGKDIYRESLKSHPIKTVNIYCESFSFANTLRLPEVEVNIVAKELFASSNAKGYHIDTSPLKWESGYAPADLGRYASGKNGANAGKINIHVATAHQTIKVNASGTDGTLAPLPEFKINFPKTKKEHNVCWDAKTLDNGTYHEGDCEKSSRNFVFKNASAEVVGLKSKYFGWGTGDGREDYIDFDSEIRGEKEKNWKRISGDKTMPGKGGNGANVVISKTLQDKIDVHQVAGKNGQFYAKYKIVEYKDFFGQTGTQVEQTKDYHPLTKFSSAHLLRPFMYMHVSTHNNRLNFKSHDYDQHEGQIFMIPSDGHWKDYYKRVYKNENFNFEKPFAKKEANKAGKTVKTDADFSSAIPFLKHYIAYLDNQYSNYLSFLPKEQKELKQELNDLIVLVEEMKIDPIKTRADTIYNSKLDNVLLPANELKDHTNYLLDAYGNAPGYRPILSFKQIADYVENKSLDNITRMLYAERLSSELTEEGERREMMNKTRDYLITRNSKLLGDLTEYSTKYDQIENEAEKQVASLAKLQNQLKDLESNYKQNENMKGWKRYFKTNLKLASIALSVIPYGQPATAEVGNAMSRISDDIGNKEISAGQIFKDFDYGSVIKTIANKSAKSQEEQLKKQKFFKKYLKPSDDNTEFVIDYNKISTSDRIKWSEEDYFQKKQDALNNRKKRVNAVAKMGNQGLKELLNFSTPLVDAQATLKKRRNLVPYMKDVMVAIEKEMKVRSALFKDLKNINQKAGNAQVELLQNASTIQRILKQRTDGEVKVDEALHDASKQMYAIAMEDLRFNEYMLHKAYEYTFLKKLDARSNNYTGFKLLEKIKKRDSKTTDIEQLAKECQTFYTEDYNAMKRDIFKNITNGVNEDSDGASITITQESHSKKMNQLNNLEDKHRFSLDLKRDFFQQIIRPDQQDIRIIDMVFEEVKVAPNSCANGTKFQLKISLPQSDGVLRSDTNFYYFQTDHGDKPQAWTVDCKCKDNKVSLSNFSHPSESYTDLIRFITERDVANSNPKRNIFMYNPAWTKIDVEIDKINSSPLPTIEELSFRIKRTYKSWQSKTHAVLDIKLNNKSEDFFYYLIDKKDNKKTLLTDDYYNVLPKGNYELTFGENEAPFVWKEDTRVYGRTMEFRLEDNKVIEIQAVSDTKGVLTSEVIKLVPIYAAPNTQSEMITTLSPQELKQLERRPDNVKDGFTKVLIGFQEGYIKE